MSSKSYLIVGHGGQGVLDLGNFIAYDAISHGQKVAYTPSYGPETRGGKVRCYVIRSDEEIDSPIIDEPDVLVAMNNPSMDFETVVKPKGLLLMNSSLIDRPQTRKDIETVQIPATEIAEEVKKEGVDLADTRVLQNAVMYGAIIASENEAINEEQTRTVLGHVYLGTKSRFIPANLKAVLRGDGFVKASGRLCQLWGS
jgi:2-oxoglutarate ferredoxin oxidoreductase subunit gamma